ncbi:MAG: hypothetical protein H0S80_04315 [Desulfovibrionaceae bacterium]|nr:hypothetical protein [Desulfovibrionaceae bacterium]
MKVKASIITFFVFLLLAGNAFASYTYATGFDSWSTVNGPEASAMFLSFSGNWATSSTAGGAVDSVTASNVDSTINFLVGANEFVFTYTAPVTITITMADNVFTDSTLSYANPFTNDPLSTYSYLSHTLNSITYNLPGGIVDGWDASFGFYANDGQEKYFPISSITFELDSSSAVVLTNFDYNPVPIPGAAWLLGSGLIGLVGLRRFKA